MTRLPLLAVALTAAATLTLAGCASGTTTSTSPTPPRTVTSPPPATTLSPTTTAPTTTAPTTVVLPEVEGRNGQIVLDELEELGLTNVNTASADENATFVVLPANWTAVSIEPAAGTRVDSDDTVVVTLTKQR